MCPKKVHKCLHLAAIRVSTDPLFLHGDEAGNWAGPGNLCDEEGMHHCRAAPVTLGLGNVLFVTIVWCGGSQPRGCAEKPEKIPGPDSWLCLNLLLAPTGRGKDHRPKWPPQSVWLVYPRAGTFWAFLCSTPTTSPGSTFSAVWGWLHPTGYQE